MKIKLADRGHRCKGVRDNFLRGNDAWELEHLSLRIRVENSISLVFSIFLFLYRFQIRFDSKGIFGFNKPILARAYISERFKSSRWEVRGVRRSRIDHSDVRSLDFFTKGHKLFVFRFRFLDSLRRAYFWARSALGDRIPGQRKSFATKSRDNLGFLFANLFHCFSLTSVAWNIFWDKNFRHVAAIERASDQSDRKS